MVVDAEQTDVDIHILGDPRDGTGCVARTDCLVEITLGAGVHHLAVDTFVAPRTAHSGEYLLMLAVP